MEISLGFSSLYPTLSISLTNERTEFLNVSAASIFLTAGNGFTMRLAVAATVPAEREKYFSGYKRNIL